MIDEVLCMVKGRAVYTDEVQYAHHVLQCVLSRQLTVDWLQHPVVEEDERDVEE